MNIVLKIIRFVWKNKSWIIPAVTEGYQLVKRFKNINKLKRAKK